MVAKRTASGMALGLLMQANRTLETAMDRRIREEAGLSLPLGELLVHLFLESSQRLRMVDLTRRMCVTKGNVTQLIDRLERQGLVTRESDQNDRRIVYAVLTPSGRSAAEEGMELFD